MSLHIISTPATKMSTSKTERIQTFMSFHDRNMNKIKRNGVTFWQTLSLFQKAGPELLANNFLPTFWLILLATAFPNLINF
jgi:hypothetical protein